MQNPKLLLFRVGCSLALVWIVGAVPRLHAAGENDFDSYTVKINAAWFYSQPSGTIQGVSGSRPIDLKKDINLPNISTFAGKLDWKFTRKNHLYFTALPITISHQTTLVRTIVFQGQTFVPSITTQTQLAQNLYALGYQYDIIRRARGHIGVGAQLDVFDLGASFNAAAQVRSNGVQRVATAAEGSLTAPIPVLGLDGRFYLTNSPRFYVQANLYGMDLFGYGNLISSTGSLGVRVAKHLSVIAGYNLGSRLKVHNRPSTNRIGVGITQTGPIVGVEVPFGGGGQ